MQILDFLNSDAVMQLYHWLTFLQPIEDVLSEVLTQSVGKQTLNDT